MEHPILYVETGTSMRMINVLFQFRRRTAAVLGLAVVTGPAWWIIADDRLGKYVFESPLLNDSESTADGETGNAPTAHLAAEVKFQLAADRTVPELAEPVRLEADGKPMDIGPLSFFAHAGPTVADVDCDGDCDLLVGDFPGHFWFFRNKGTDESPLYASVGKLQAGNEDAKTPVY